ncbi:hypothetical protein Cgig2_003632 [Carnegiea gigantea]|uniref:Uncharacterized protein n=1 Tax=Carnegiea gigantea TaxID=171969 RepID=A0A9Q1K8D5_9CARY|nr:hypothetical protein Cgig2_003632 [Carnegiea gigantea]
MLLVYLRKANRTPENLGYGVSLFIKNLIEPLVGTIGTMLTRMLIFPVVSLPIRIIVFCCSIPRSCLQCINNLLLDFILARLITNRLIRQQEKLMLFNLKYWGWFSQKQWLIDGERNSRFFHQTATIRKHCSYISRIKNELGGRIEEIDLIKNKFVLEFFLTGFLVSYSKEPCVKLLPTKI